MVVQRKRGERRIDGLEKRRRELSREGRERWKVCKGILGNQKIDAHKII
jgi:hypothetical protein